MTKKKKKKKKKKEAQKKKKKKKIPQKKSFKKKSYKSKSKKYFKSNLYKMMMLNLDSAAPSGGQLNKELSAQTNAKKPLFSVPFGDKTVFHAKDGGAIMVTFIFDPDHPYNSSFNTASITSDYLSDMRKELTQLLLDEKDIKPLKPTKEESIWTHIRSAVPKEVLVQYFKEHKEQMSQYIDILRKDAELDYNEDSKLTDAMQNDFTFKYQVAIDAYPSQMDKNSSRRSTSEMEVPTGRKGVLTFYIQGMSANTLKLTRKSSPLDYPRLMVDFETNGITKKNLKKYILILMMMMMMIKK